MRLPLLFAAGAIAAMPLAALSAAAPDQPVSWTIPMTGTAEVPGPGDPDATGVATVDVDAASGQICYTLSVQNIATATMAHIHKGAVGVAGPVATPLTAPDADGYSKGCVTDKTLAAAIIADPAGYYVNVHNADYPKGAMRGQFTAQ